MPKEITVPVTVRVKDLVKDLKIIKEINETLEEIIQAEKSAFGRPTTISDKCRNIRKKLKKAFK